jgi:hypothetical protein
MPSSRPVKKSIVCSVSASSRKIYEMGSGWGGLACSLSKQFPDAEIHAFEISPIPWLFSVILKKIRGCKNLYLHRSNFYRSSLSDADLVVCYLFPKAMSLLKIKMEKELPPGAWVISNSFGITGWNLYKSVKVNDFWRSHIYIYRKNSI